MIMDKTKLRRILASEGLIPKTAGRFPRSPEQIALIEKEGWPDMMSQAEASDWAVNTIREMWRERGMAGRPEQMMREEFNRIQSGNLDYLKYLRVSRAGSKFRLSRVMRRAVYLQYLAKNKSVKSETWRRLANQQVAQTILRQMGGTGRLGAMINAKNFVSYPAAADSKYGEGLGGAAFKFSNPGRGKPNFIKIILNERDYYDVELGRQRGLNFKVLKKIEDLPASNLKSFFERETGLYLSL
jgi:hypothetical protein